jgi:hypothetical protein
VAADEDGERVTVLVLHKPTEQAAVSNVHGLAQESGPAEVEDDVTDRLIRHRGPSDSAFPGPYLLLPARGWFDR